MDIYRILNGLVDNSTSEALNAPDANAMREVSELVRSRADMPKEVIKLISNKLMRRDKKVTLLCLELLEYLTYACEITLYNQIATKDFLLKMGTILKSHDLGEMVISRACRLIKCWRDLFNRELHQFFFQFYENVVKKGIDIPSGYVSPYASLKGNQPSSSTSFKQPSASFVSSNSTAQKQPVPTSGPKAKLRSDLELIKSNISLVNEMIDNQDPKQNVDQNDSLNDLMPTLKKQETQMQTLIEKLAIENDETLLEMCLQINDDLLATQERYQSLKRHMKPKPFRSKAVEDDLTQQIQKLDINSDSLAAFSENVQALNQTVTKAQFKIPPPTGGLSQPQLQQQQQQPAVVQQPQKVQKPAVNLLDDDEDDVQPVVTPIVQLQQQQQPLQSNGFNQPTTVNQQQQQAPQPSLTQLYNQSEQQQSQLNQQQNKYAALNSIGQPNQMGMGMGGQMGMNPMGMNQMGFNTMNNGMGGGMNPMGYNTMAGGMGGYVPVVPPQQNYGGYGMGGAMGQPLGYGQQQTGGYGNTQPVTSFNTGYGGGLPSVSSTLPSTNTYNGSNSYAQNAGKKDAFDDLDDMFGIGGPSSSGANTNKSVMNNQSNQPVKQTVDFDLF